MRKSYLLAFCGLEGAGKTTAIQNVVATIKAMSPGQNITLVREPGGTPLAEQLRSLVKSSHQETVDPMTELLLMYAARIQLFINVINPALARGDIVISDRFWGCSFAHQIVGLGKIPIETYKFIHQNIMKEMPEYDAVFYLDIDPRVGLKRVLSRGEGLDAIEQRDIEFFDRARSGYQHLCETNSNMFSIDASCEPGAVAEMITKKISSFTNV